jgi:hypothetical protein
MEDRKMKFPRIAPLCLALAGVAVLAGCASDPRSAQGRNWVVEQQAERTRLEAQGFPQYAHD